jgi:hypothetical protein
MGELEYKQSPIARFIVGYTPYSQGWVFSHWYLHDPAGIISSSSLMEQLSSGKPAR